MNIFKERDRVIIKETGQTGTVDYIYDNKVNVLKDGFSPLYGKELLDWFDILPLDESGIIGCLLKRIKSLEDQIESLREQMSQNEE